MRKVILTPHTPPTPSFDMPKLTPIQFVPSTPSFLASAPDKPRTVPEERFVGMVIQKDLEIAEIKKLSEARAAHDQSTIVMLHRLVAKLEAEVAAVKAPVDLGPGLASRINQQAQALNQGANCTDGFGPSDPAPPSVKPADPAPAKPPLPARALTAGSTMKIGTFLP
jgi:hypothetical protein